jgi:hypothetical protein
MTRVFNHASGSAFDGQGELGFTTNGRRSPEATLRQHWRWTPGAGRSHCWAGGTSVDGLRTTTIAGLDGRMSPPASLPSTENTW